MPIKKTPNENRTKSALRGQSPARVMARVGPRDEPRRHADASPCAILTQKRGFSPFNSKSDHFQTKPSLYNILTPLITSYNITQYQDWWLFDHHFLPNPQTLTLITTSYKNDKSHTLGGIDNPHLLVVDTSSRIWSTHHQFLFSSSLFHSLPL